MFNKDNPLAVLVAGLLVLAVVFGSVLVFAEEPPPQKPQIGVLVGRQAAISGDSVTWFCHYQTTRGEVVVTQAVPCEAAKSLP